MFAPVQSKAAALLSTFVRGTRGLPSLGKPNFAREAVDPKCMFLPALSTIIRRRASCNKDKYAHMRGHPCTPFYTYTLLPQVNCHATSGRALAISFDPDLGDTLIHNAYHMYTLLSVILNPVVVYCTIV